MTPSDLAYGRVLPREGPLYPQLVEAPGATARAERIRAGDEGAFEAFFRELYPPLVAFLQQRTRSRVVAEEVAQDAFVAVWERRSGIDPARSLRAYLFRAALNRLSSRGRRLRLELRVREWLRLGPGRSRTPEDDAVEGELRRALHRAIEGLPPRCREVFLLARDAHMSYAEIAATLELSPKTVENHMGRALRLLRDALSGFLD